MKSKVLAILCTAVLGIGLSACQQNEAQSAPEAQSSAETETDSKPAAGTENKADAENKADTEKTEGEEVLLDEEDVLDGEDILDTEDEDMIILDEDDADFEILDESEYDEDYSIEVPECVKNLSEEDNTLLNGELKDGVYTNKYFGYKFSIPEGDLSRDNDDAEDTSELLSFASTYDEGWGGISFTGSPDDLDGYITVYITALDDDEVGLGEKELVEKNIEYIKEINEEFGEEGNPEYSTAVLAGEEHPVSVYEYEMDGEKEFSADFFIPKDHFVYVISLNATNGKIDDVTKYFEKL